MSVPTDTMASVSVRSRALALKRLLTEDHAALTLLRADNLAVTAAVLAERLGAPGSRLASDELFEQVESDLETLRTDHVLPQTARVYCEAWREVGLLKRRPVPGGRGETWELTAEARDALRVLDQISAPAPTLTESRLVALAGLLHQLAVDTDPDVSRRIAAKQAEIERLNDEISRLRSGETDVLDPQRAVERATDVLTQARDLPGDFGRVRARFEELNAELRTRILDSEETQSRVLDDVFRGVDVITASDEGRTFTAFAALLRDPERSAALESDIASILRRSFSSSLSGSDRRALRTLVRELKGGSREVHGVLTEFARGLRRYVQSQEFQRDRELRKALAGALAAAAPTSRIVRPFHQFGGEVELSTMSLRSVGELSLHDPREFDPGEPLDDDEPDVTGFEALATLARESEIDFAELIRNIDDVLGDDGPRTVGDVLASHPASQGVASVVGLLSLATRHGEIDDDAVEHLEWDGLDGVRRRASVSRHSFVGRIEE